MGKLRFVLIWVGIPLLDVGLLLVLAGWIGAFPTLGLVLLSTLIGLFGWWRWYQFLKDEETKLRAEYGTNIPPDVLLIRGGEAVTSILAFVCFLAPGFITDLIGCFLMLPKLLNPNIEDRRKKLRDFAARQGKTIDELFNPR